MDYERNVSHSDWSFPLHNTLWTRKVKLPKIDDVSVLYQAVQSRSLMQRQDLSRAGLLVVTSNQFVKVLSERLASKAVDYGVNRRVESCQDYRDLV